MGSAHGLANALPFGASAGLPSLDLALTTPELDSRVTFSRSSNARMYTTGGMLWNAPSNLFTYSNDFSNGAWSRSNTTFTSGIAGYSGGISGWSAVENNSSAYLNRITAATVVTGQSYTVRFKAKYMNSPWVRVSIADSGAGTNAARFWFNIQTGVVGGSNTVGAGWTVVSSEIEAAGNGWYWCSCTAVAGSGTSLYTLICSANGDTLVSKLDLGSGVGIGTGYYLMEYQVGPYPQVKSYVATTSAAAYGPRIEGNLREAPTWTYSSTELCPDPTCDNSGVWTLGANVVVANGRITGTNTSNEGARCNVSFVAGKFYRIQFDYYLQSGGSITVYKGSGSQILGYAVPGMGRFDEVVQIWETGTAILLINQQNAGTYNFWVDNVSVTEATPTYPTAGLLMEGAATNITTYSEGVNSTSNGAGATYASSNGSILGCPARRITGDGAASSHYGGPSTTTPAGSTQYTVSVFVRDVNLGRVQLFVGSGWNAAATAYINFNFNTKSITAVGASASNAFAWELTPGIWRIGFSFTTDVAPVAASYHLALITADGDTRLPTNSTSAAIDCYGFQMETGAFATSYIPTFGATSTRALETAYIPTAGWLNASQGTILGEGTFFPNPGSGIMCEGWTSSLAAGVTLGTGSTGQAYARVIVRHGANRADNSHTALLTPGRKVAMAGTWGASAFMSTDGATISGGAPAQNDWSTNLYIGYRGGNTNWWYGHISRVTVWPFILDQATLNRYTLAPSRIPQPAKVWDFSTAAATLPDALATEGFTFARTSNAMHFDSQGRLVWAPANMWAYSEDLSHSTWVKTNATIASTTEKVNRVAFKLAEDNTSNIHYVNQTTGITFAANDQLTVSVYLKAAERTFALVNLVGAWVGATSNAIGVNLTTGAIIAGTGSPLDAVVTDAGNGWWRVSFRVVGTTSGNASLNVYTSQDGLWANRVYLGTTGSGICVSSPQLERTGVDSPKTYFPTYNAVTYGPRLDYSPSTLTVEGLLFEEARTNSLRNSTAVGAVVGTPGTLPTNWSYYTPATGLTVSVVGFGLDNGIPYLDWRVSGTPVHASPYIALYSDSNTGIAASQGQTWTSSVFAQLVGGSLSGITSTIISIGEYDAVPTFLGSAYATITPTTASLRTQRYSYTRTLPTVGTAWVRTWLQWGMTNGVPVDFTIRIGLPQMELGAFVTSPLPTFGAAATRAAESLTQSVAEFSRYWRQDEGTMILETERPAVSIGADGTAVHIDDTTANERYAFGTGATGSVHNPFGTDGGVSQFAINNGASSALGAKKWAIAWATNDIAAITGGYAFGTPDTAATLPQVDRLRMGVTNASANWWNGWIKKVSYYRSRLANARVSELVS